MLEAEPGADGFDARRDARSRTYCYWVAGVARAEPVRAGPCSLVAASRWTARRSSGCAAACVGTHDFTAFTPTDTEHVRFERDVLGCEWRVHRSPSREGELLELWIEADAFMRHMVRVLVGTMLEVGRGRRDGRGLRRAARAARRASARATPRRAHGLYLARVAY